MTANTDADINNLAEKIINLFCDEDLEIAFQRNDYQSQMTAYFYYKQRNHLISLLKLSDDYDAQLICRSMIEGYVHLACAQSDGSISEKWMTSSNVENLRILKLKEQAGIEVNDEIKEKIIDHIPHAEGLLKEKRKKDIEQTGRTPEYSDYESPLEKRISKLREGLPDKAEMFDFYDEFSKWQHWNISAFSTFIRLENNELIINEKDERYPLTLKWGVFCLLLTSEILSNQFSLGKEEALSALFQELIDNF